jgi:choline kinase
MNRHTRKIRGKNAPPIQVIILAAGVGARTKSYEPRCLLKYGGKHILDYQMEVLNSKFSNPQITIVGGFDISRLIKKVGKQARIIENQIFDSTNNGESLKLGVNNSLLDNILFLHSDLVISSDIFDKVSFDKSFLLVDSTGKFDEKEVGVTVVDKKATILSYSLPTKWCQIAYLAENEVNIFRKLILKPDFNFKVLLTFEVINKIIDNGGNFECFEIGPSFIKEIDSLKDINNEPTGR